MLLGMVPATATDMLFSFLAQVFSLLLSLIWSAH